MPFVEHDIPRRGIVAWSGSVDDLPHGMVLCDGTKYTPDLRDKFIVGAGSTYAPDDSNGAIQHDHDFTSDSHAHSFEFPAVRLQGAPVGGDWQSLGVTGTTETKDGRPPYYALAYIMRKRWN